MSMKKEEPELTDAPTWFIDPIDGTTNFIHTFPQACISVGLTVCKEPVLGIIYNPVTSELYSAMKGKGAFLNGKPIHTSNVTGNASVASTSITLSVCAVVILLPNMSVTVI